MHDKQVRTGAGEAHAKVILSGEHAVVYGKPAIAYPVHALGLRAEVRLEGNEWFASTPYHAGVVRRTGATDNGLARVLSETALTNVLAFLGEEPDGIRVQVTGLVPPARGLGSSAAVAAAIVRAVAQTYDVTLNDEELFELVQSVERVAHGTPSGLDARAVVADDAIWFHAGEVTQLHTRTRPRLLLADTGLKGHTAQAVTTVRERRSIEPERINRMLDAIGEITVQARGVLETGDLEHLGALLTTNHSILADLGVSHERLDALVDCAVSAGALGAKLTGGGMGGCVVALVTDTDSQQRVTRALEDAGAVNVWQLHGEEHHA